MERGDFLEEYLLKLGIFRVDEYSSEEPKGLWKEDLEASETPLRCWQEATAAREVVGSCWRAQARSRELEAEERDMAREAIAADQLLDQGGWSWGGGRGGRKTRGVMVRIFGQNGDWRLKSEGRHHLSFH